ncbi:Cytochrome b-c1 complex subunit 9 [Halocaridina rubra]|uniref:Complex III subunit 9 n=1 Tax=Halocaridina rubra TaxID=373956 RepID=A0AAN9A380_HALRR
MAGVIGKLYQNVFRRTSSFVLAAIFGAFMFERGFDMVSDGVFENINQGKLWKHIKHSYGQQEEGGDEEEE